MPRYIFSPANVTTGGRPARVTVYRSSTSPNRVVDLYRITTGDQLAEPISNGVIVVASDGDPGEFAGPVDVETLFLATDEGNRTEVTALRPSAADAATVLLIDTAEDLPVGTPPGTVVVVKG
jgi:hypothetical protein